MALFQANSEVLQEVAKLFREQADEMSDAFQNFASIAEDVRGNAWIGLGADTFFDQFDSELTPEANRLLQNLEAAAGGIDRVVGTIEDGISRILAAAKSPI